MTNFNYWNNYSGAGPAGDFANDGKISFSASFAGVLLILPPVFFLFCYHDPLVIVAVQSSQVSAHSRRILQVFVRLGHFEERTEEGSVGIARLVSS